MILGGDTGVVAAFECKPFGNGNITLLEVQIDVQLRLTLGQAVLALTSTKQWPLCGFIGAVFTN